jgi:hypothetical protein
MIPLNRSAKTKIVILSEAKDLLFSTASIIVSD